jgi:hypothetical protein
MYLFTVVSDYHFGEYNRMILADNIYATRSKNFPFCHIPDKKPIGISPATLSNEPGWQVTGGVGKAGKISIMRQPQMFELGKLSENTASQFFAAHDF